AFTHYPTCQDSNILKLDDKCEYLDRFGGIILVNEDSSDDAVVEIEYSVLFALNSSSLMSGLETSYYTIDGEDCIVLDPTLGPDSSPGMDATTGNKFAYDPITKEVEYLS
ncbi:hypothetical protein D6764_01305, partial [Candidatus Woesearchaeota archaeon]